MKNPLKIFCDGGARGNPGEAAAAFVVERDGKIIYFQAAYLGKTTNNAAEYRAVVLALKWLIQNRSLGYPRLPDGQEVPDITFFLDSELVTKQINGDYRVKNKNLKNIFAEVNTLINQIPNKIIFKNIPRAKNKKADFLVNQKLDSRL